VEVDSFLSEALPGEEHHFRLMMEAMSKINVTTSTYAHKVHPNSRDIKVANLNVILKGKVLLEDADLSLAYGSRYGLVGANGCGKSLLMTLLGRRMLPLPKNLDVFHLAGEIEPSEMTALEAVMAVDVERRRLETLVTDLEALLTGEDTPEQEELNNSIFEAYERLDALGVSVCCRPVPLLAARSGAFRCPRHRIGCSTCCLPTPRRLITLRPRRRSSCTAWGSRPRPW